MSSKTRDVALEVTPGEPQTRRDARIQARPRGGERARDAAITVVGSCGLLVLTWLLVSMTFHLSLTVFVTGSMSPTMPAGSVAVVQTVPAADLAVGDVVTVAHADTGRPVTHRIVDVQAAPGDEGARTLRLKGDANDVVDSDPYVVAEAPKVLLAVPGLGYAMIWSKNPLVMIIATVLIASAIAWALWPSSRAVAPEGGARA